jgi:hypothetical protein
MVSSENGDSARVSYLEADKESHGLNGIVSSVHIVSHEKVVVFREFSTNFE